MEAGLYKTVKNRNQLSEFKDLDLFGLKGLGILGSAGGMVR